MCQVPVLAGVHVGASQLPRCGQAQQRGCSKGFVRIAEGHATRAWWVDEVFSKVTQAVGTLYMFFLFGRHDQGNTVATSVVLSCTGSHVAQRAARGTTSHNFHGSCLDLPHFSTQLLPPDAMARIRRAHRLITNPATTKYTISSTLPIATI